MRKATLVLAAAIVAAVPALASANAHSDAQKQCRAERAAMGTATFKLTYGTNADRSNAFGKCVSKKTRANVKVEAAAKQSATAQCTAERTADPAAFAAKYGAGKNDNNAFTRCVAQKFKAIKTTAEKADTKSDVNAARTCRAERSSIGSTAFANKYGTNRNKRNAFGKCVSQHAKPYSI